MNLKQLIKFGLENSSDPVIKNPVLRSALEKPRSMDQAALSDDVVPGRLKDELEGKFNPDQETYEEYLQRINLERPFNMNQGGRIGFFKGGKSRYDNLSPDMKKFYKKITGKTWNKEDWDEGNYRRINKSRKAKDVVKKKQKLSPYYKKVEFMKQYGNNQRMLVEENKLLKKGYISARKLNQMLGRPETESSSEDLIRVLTGDRESPWLDEIEGVKKWKKSKILRKDIKLGGGSTYFKMPDKKTLEGLKSYYNNQEFLSDFKYGRIKEPSIKGAKLFYDDKVLMNNLRKWSGNTKEIDKPALKVLNSVFGADNWAGPNAIKNLGRALSGEIKIEGIKVDKKLGKKILDGMSRTANSKYGGSIWDQAAYAYAKDRMNMLFKNKGSKNFTQLYDDTEKILIDVLGKKRGKVAIDEVLSLRTGFTNDAQVYSVFSQVIDKKVNETFKQSYDSNLSRNFKKIREELAKGDEANLDKIKGWTDQQNVSLANAQKKYPGIKFANLGKFNYETGKFASPEETFGSKRFADLPSDIQKRIRKDFRTSGVSVDVGGAGTQKEVISDLSKASDELKSLKPKQQMELLKKMGYRCAKSVGAGETVACYMDDVKKTRADIKSPDVTVRAKALTKQRKALKIGSKLPQIGKIIRQGLQVGAAGVSTAFNWSGLGAPIAYAVEGVVEGGIYDYYRKQGYNHDQAFAETFTPGLIAGRPEGVPWYGGAEALRKKELIGDVQQNPKVKQYTEALKDQQRVYDVFAEKERGIKAGRKDITDLASADIQDLNRSGTISRINRIMNPESMASQAYNTAVEKQQALDERRKKDYMDKYYNVKEPSPFMQEKKQKNRYKEMNEMFPPYTPEGIQAMYPKLSKQLNAEQYKELMEFFSDLDKKSYYADNFRMEKAGGGIAGIRRPNAIPPESGPNPQGLPSMYNRVRRI